MYHSLGVCNAMMDMEYIPTIPSETFCGLIHDHVRAHFYIRVYSCDAAPTRY